MLQLLTLSLQLAWSNELNIMLSTCALYIGMSDETEWGIELRNWTWQCTESTREKYIAIQKSRRVSGMTQSVWEWIMKSTTHTHTHIKLSWPTVHIRTRNSVTQHTLHLGVLSWPTVSIRMRKCHTQHTCTCTCTCTHPHILNKSYTQIHVHWL